MSSIVLILVISLMGLSSCAQDKVIKSQTESFFQANSEGPLAIPILKNIEVENLNLDDLNLDDYEITKVYDEIDINSDKISDLVMLIKKKSEKVGTFNIKEPSKNLNRILLFCNANGKGKYILSRKLLTILNQDTDGLFHSYLKILSEGDEIVIRESGRQIDTDWATDIRIFFSKKEKEWYLKKTVAYSASIGARGTIIKDPIIVKKVNDAIPVTSINYYDYFPFGFSDEIPASR